MIEVVEQWFVADFRASTLHLIIYVHQEILFHFFIRQKLFRRNYCLGVDTWEEELGGCLIEKEHVIALVLEIGQVYVTQVEANKHKR